MSSYSKSRGYRGSGFRKGGLTKKRSSPSDDDTAPRASKKAKDGSDAEDDAPLIPKLLKDDDGNDFVNLKANGTRRATVHEFKGSTLVSIREYYKDDKGVLKPGKKGISLTMEQYNALLAAAPLLESVLKGKEENVARPDYGAALASEKVDGDTASKAPMKTASDTEEGDDED